VFTGVNALCAKSKTTVPLSFLPSSVGILRPDAISCVHAVRVWASVPPHQARVCIHLTLLGYTSAPSAAGVLE
jgi:hypothetical protein